MPDNRPGQAVPLSRAEIDGLIALYSQGKLEDVIRYGDELVRRHPRVEILHNILGAANAGLKRLDQAVLCFRNALLISPGSPEAHNNLANVLKDIGQREEAMASYRSALAIKPDYAAVHNNLANVLRDLGRIDEAMAGYQRALAIMPGYAEAHYNLGVTLRAVGRRDEAIASYAQALKIKPDYAEVFNGLGNVLKDLGQRDKAITAYQRAIRIKPDYADAFANLGNVLKDMGRRPEAIACYERSLAIAPGEAAVRAQKLHQQAHICDWDAIAGDAALIPALGVEGGSVSPFSMLAFEDSPERHHARSKKYGADIHRQSRHLAFARPAARPSRLRIGYFSADFHNHATMYLMARFFELHDRDRFEIFAYSYGPDKDDAMRQRARAGVDHFHDVRALGDEAVADLARQHGLDIAVDLKGYSQNGRVGILAYRAAPVQMTYLGYPGTLALPFIDYMIADRVVIPQEQRLHYAERIIYVGGSYFVNDDRRAISDRPITRAELGLPDKGFVFCCFNNSFKIGAEEFGIWMRLLDKVEGSVLWLLKANPWAENNLRAAAVKAGITPDRLIFAEPLPQAEHLARHRLADLFLDSFHYNAHTTACDSLWAGLPVMTRMGNGMATRVAGSLLQSIGLPELITTTSEDYEQLAVQLANDAERLAGLRQTLQDKLGTAPLFRPEFFTRDVEKSYDRAFALYCSGAEPADIPIE